MTLGIALTLLPDACRNKKIVCFFFECLDTMYKERCN